MANEEEEGGFEGSAEFVGSGSEDVEVEDGRRKGSVEAE
jgi:hypothetical protein